MTSVQAVSTRPGDQVSIRNTLADWTLDTVGRPPMKPQ